MVSAKVGLPPFTMTLLCARCTLIYVHSYGHILDPLMIDRLRRLGFTDNTTNFERLVTSSLAPAYCEDG